ncbi:MAG: hypothetical protein WCX77_03685 [Candidatus Paceibacterota bacterium]|jgi:hypothetical protein
MKNKALLSFVTVAGLLFAEQALAVCPLCTLAVGTGLGLSRWLGIDDTISGLWIGGLLLSLTLWTINWLAGKNIKFRFMGTVVGALYFGMTIGSLFFSRIVGDPIAFLCSCFKDKLIIGIIVGTAAFYFGATLYEYLKGKNGGKAHFPFEKMAMPIAPLVILSIVFYFLTK